MQANESLHRMTQDLIGRRNGGSHDHDAGGYDHTRGVPSRAAIAGHPIHPALFVFPIALLVGAFGADVGYWIAGDFFWARAALWLVGLGAGTGVVAAGFGLVDFLAIERTRVHRIGWFHSLGAGAVLALAAGSWLLRIEDPAGAVLPWGITLSATTAALLAVVGWAGGELARRHMISVTGHAGHAHGNGEPVDTRDLEQGHDHEHKSMSTAAPSANGHGSMGHSDMGHQGMSMESRATRPQIAVVGAMTVIALAGSLLYSASYANLTISAKDVEGAVMPPGMIQSWDTPPQAMREMAAVDPGDIAYRAPADGRGDLSLEPRVDGDVKVFDLEASVIEWNILPGQRVAAYAFNKQVPGPRIRVTQGDQVRVNVTNNLPEETAVHWHGLILPNEMDGAAEITQPPLEPGKTFTYEFTAGQQGTYFYHSHKEPDRQQALGLYGALIVDPKDPAVDATYDYDHEVVVQLQEWLEKEGYTYPAMLMEGALPNFFTINGKAYPETETVKMRVGERLRVRFIGSNNNFVHPMHIHGGPFKIVQTDGEPVPEAAQLLKDTVNVGPGERYDVIWEARRPGKWLLHCHIPHHTTNDNVEHEGGGGLMMVIEVVE